MIIKKIFLYNHIFKNKKYFIKKNILIINISLFNKEFNSYYLKKLIKPWKFEDESNKLYKQLILIKFLYFSFCFLIKINYQILF